MRQFLSLFSVQFKSKYNIGSYIKLYRTQPRKLLSGLGMLCLMAYAFGTLIWLYVEVLSVIYDPAAMMGQPELVLEMVVMLSQLIMLMFGVFYVIGMLYFSKDTQFLASLPVSQGKIFLSKLLLVLISELFTAILFIGPGVILYGVNTGAGPAFYLKALAVFIFSPAIPIALASLLALPFMRIFTAVKRRSMVIVIGGMVLMLLLMLGSMSLSSIMIRAEMGENPGLDLLAEGGLIRAVGAYYKPAMWAALGIARTGGESATNLLIFIGVSVGLLVLVQAIASRIFIKGALAQEEAAKRSTKKAGVAKIASSSPVMAVFKKEWRVLVRIPVYAMNSLFSIIIGPIVIFMPALMGQSTGGNMSEVIDMIKGLGDIGYVVLGVAGFAAFMANFATGAVSTMVSREGRSFYINKILPVDAAKITLGKLLCGYSIAVMSIITAVASCAAVLKLDAWQAIAAGLLACVISWPINALNLVVDAASPRLTWDNPQVAIKRNINVMWGMLINLFYIGLHVGVALLLGSLGADLTVLWVSQIVLALVAAAVSQALLNSVARKRMLKIEG